MGKGNKSKYAAKLDQRRRDSDIAAKAERKANGGRLSSYYETVSRPRPFVPTQQVPIEQFVKEIAQRNAARNGGRAARAERPEPPALNVRLANFAFITPGFSGLESETIEFAGHEFAAIPTDVESGSTYLHVRNTNDGWEIERHFVGGWRRHTPVTSLLPLAYTDKEGMIAKLESWVHNQNAKGFKKSINHMNDHLMARMVNPKVEKPAPTQSSQRAKQWGAAIAGPKQEEPRKTYQHLVTLSFEGIAGKPFTLFGKEFGTPRPDIWDLTYISAVTMGDGVWEVSRYVDGGNQYRVCGPHFVESTDKDFIVSELASWVRAQEYENREPHKMHLSRFSQAELVTADSDGFKSPYQTPKKPWVDPNELTYG